MALENNLPFISSTTSPCLQRAQGSLTEALKARKAKESQIPSRKKYRGKKSS